VKSSVAYQTKKRNFCSLSRSRFCADRTQNLSGPAADNILRVPPTFHPNPFTSGEDIAERVNVVETRHKVFPILGEATASSPSKNCSKYTLLTATDQKPQKSLKGTINHTNIA